MTCDVCNTTEAVHFGRWIGWCDLCDAIGQDLDDQKTYDNEIAPDIESGDFSYTAAHNLGDVLERVS